MDDDDRNYYEVIMRLPGVRAHSPREAAEETLNWLRLEMRDDHSVVGVFEICQPDGSHVETVDLAPPEQILLGRRRPLNRNG
jgi:hypothetical protein